MIMESIDNQKTTDNTVNNQCRYLRVAEAKREKKSSVAIKKNTFQHSSENRSVKSEPRDG